MPIQHLKQLIVIADSEHVRFLRPGGEDHSLHASCRANPDEGHAGDAKQPHSQHPDKFAGWIAEQINSNDLSFDELVLVAPAHTLGGIRKHLDKKIEAKIIGTLDKDLTKIPPHDLPAHLSHWIRPVHREALL